MPSKHDAPREVQVSQSQNIGELEVRVFAPSPGETGDYYDIRYSEDETFPGKGATLYVDDAIPCADKEDYKFFLSDSTNGSNPALDDDTTYYVQARQIGVGLDPSDWEESPANYATTAEGSSSTPEVTDVDISNLTAVSCTADWSSYNSNAGAYSYAYSSTSQSNPRDYIDNNGDDSTHPTTSVNLSGLTPSTTYYFYIIPWEGDGWGDGEEGDLYTETFTTHNPSVTDQEFDEDITSVDISWTSVGANSFRWATSTSNFTGNQTAINALMTNGGTNTNSNSATKTGLTQNTTYYSYVRPFSGNNQGGTQGADDIESFTTETMAIGEPTNLAYTADSAEQITITWTNPTYSDRTYIEYNFGGGWKPVKTDGELYVTGENWTCSADDQWYLIYVGYFYFVMTANTLYQFRFRTYYDGNYGDWTSTFSAYTKPGKPTLTATAVSDTAIDLSWTNPGGSALTETYTLQYTNGTNLQVATSPRSYSDAELVQSTLYQYRVFTSTVAGTSAYPHSTASATTQAGPDPTAGDLLTLGALGHATGNSDATSTSNMNTISGGTSTVSMRDFFCGGIGSATLAGPASVSLGGTAVLSMTFDNVGDQFMSKIADRADQFVWTTSNSNAISISAGPDYQATINGLLLNQTSTITCTWDANYNGSHDGISSARTADLDVTVTLEW